MDVFNDELKLLEEKIYNLALTQNQIALQKILEKENDIFDYELEVSFYVYDDLYR